VAEQVTTVWAPTGLAQAALLLWGRKLWPAVWLGAFAVNAASQAPLWTAAVIATGNTLEAVAAAWVLARFLRFDPALRRMRDSAAFIIIAAGLSPVVSATIGVAALCAAAVQSWSQFPALWFAWWLGDSIGALVVGPLVLTAARSAEARSRRDWLETGAMVAVTVGVAHLVFGRWTSPAFGHPFEYVIFPLLITAAMRQRQPATALVVAAASSVAIWNTVRGSGPFAGPQIHESLVLLQLFTGVAAATGLVLAAAIAERETSERRRAAAHAVSELLATAPSLPDAATGIVQRVCRNLHWSIGALWVLNGDTQCLRCLTVWPPGDGESGTSFAAETSRRTFSYGVGLPGRVWATGEPAWIEEITDDVNFPRGPMARREGLHSGFAFPIRVGDHVYGVLEFFSRSIVARDDDLLGTMSTLGNQLGQFVVRKQVEEKVVTARREAEAANRAKDEFLATLSHELRTPLNAIVGWTRMLLEGTLDQQSSQRALQVIDRNAQLQAQLVGDLLDVSGIISGGLKLNPVRVDLGSVIVTGVDALRPAADAKGIRVHLGMTAEARTVEGDAQRLQQIVWNLIANAIKFTPAGGRIEVELLDVGDQTLRIVVRDDGDGIDTDFLPHVFERFRQADGSASRPHGGLGLGLAIVRHLVELHGGDVRAESAGPGKGATFIVELPKLPDPVETAATA
jgi:signal transduction histidine kinase/integral membrane sensor domain MASE1